MWSLHIKLSANLLCFFFFLFHRSQSSFRRDDDSFATESLTGGFASIIISRMDGIRPSYFRPRVESTFSMRNQFLVILSTAGSFFFSDIRLTIHKVGDTVLLSSTTFSRRVFYEILLSSIVLIKHQIYRVFNSFENIRGTSLTKQKIENYFIYTKKNIHLHYKVITYHYVPNIIVLKMSFYVKKGY